MLRAASHEAGITSSSEQRRLKQQHASSWPSRLAEMGAASCGASIGQQRSAASGLRAAIGVDPSLTRAAAAAEQRRRREQRCHASSGSPSPGHHRGRVASGAYEQQSGGGQRASYDPFLNHGHPPSNGASGRVVKRISRRRAAPRLAVHAGTCRLSFKSTASFSLHTKCCEQLLMKRAEILPAKSVVRSSSTRAAGRRG
ncbi:hypothetical protein Dimus_021047 [Dionaea muscipula]